MKRSASRLNGWSSVLRNRLLVLAWSLILPWFALAPVMAAEVPSPRWADAVPWTRVPFEPMRASTPVLCLEQHAAPRITHGTGGDVAPLAALTAWSLVAWEAGTASDYHHGFTGELGIELGLPWRMSLDDREMGLIPAFSVSIGLGFRTFGFRESRFESFGVAANILTGIGIEYPAGTLLFGPFLRWELAFRPVRTAGGTPMIGASGVSALSLGAYVRFMIHDDSLPMPLPIGLYMAVDVESRARREVMIGVDLTAFFIVGALLAKAR